MVGCSLSTSRLWFTIGGGIINEVYYPRVDIPQIRDLGFLVADGHGFWVEVKRLWQHTVEHLAPGIPAVRIVHRHERFELTLRVVPCVERDALLIYLVLSGDANLRFARSACRRHRHGQSSRSGELRRAPASLGTPGTLRTGAGCGRKRPAR